MCLLREPCKLTIKSAKLASWQLCQSAKLRLTRSYYGWFCVSHIIRRAADMLGIDERLLTETEVQRLFL